MPTFSRRREIINYVIAKLKEIDGEVSPFNVEYTFTTNLYNNVFRGHASLEEINDFPAVYGAAGPERYSYETAGNTEVYIPILFRGYLRNGDPEDLRISVDNLIQDMDHIFYNMPTDVYNIHLIRVVSVDQSGSLLGEYALIEIEIAVLYEATFI